MQPVNACPERNAYQRQLHGELPPSEVERLCEHLAFCSSCSAVVQTLLGEDTLLSALRCGSVESSTEKEVPANLMRRLLALAARSPAGTAEFTPLLAPPQGPDEIGRLAHYRVLKVLGEGGMGVVYLAEDTLLGRTVAMKTMKPELAADPRHRQRFLREARAAAKVEHDHSVPIYGVGEDRGMPWLAMPFLKGQSLDQLLKRVKVLKPAQAVRLGMQVAKGLAAAHAAGLIHRDVKPANIWVEPEAGGRPRLLDFGLARDQGLPQFPKSPQREQGEELLTRMGTILGTPAFMAPEQAQGEPLDGRADLFSLGCVLYRAVTGRLPFQGQGMMGTLRALATETRPAPHEVNSAVPQPLSALIMMLLAKDRSARPASAAMVAAALQAIQEKLTEPVPVAQPVAIPVTPRQKESNSWADLTEVAEPRAPVAAPRRGWRLATVAALLLVLGGALAAGIVVIIKNKDGKEVARVPIPGGGSAEIKQDGGSSKRKVDPGDKKPDRRAAEWVLSIGGTIKIRQGGQLRDIQAAKDLPAAPLEVIDMNLEGLQKVDDAGLAHLKELTNLTGLSLAETRVGDAGLIHLKGLTNLTSLNLAGTRVSDAGLEHLKGLTNLTKLWVGTSGVSGAGLEHLKGLTNLTTLDLANAPVNDAGLVHLKGLSNLAELDLRGTRVSDAGLVHLKGLTYLRALGLEGTQVSGAGLEHLKELNDLESLGLKYTLVSDAGLEHLAGLSHLRGLSLTGTGVSGAGLEHLKGLNHLELLDLTSTPVSDAGLIHLKELPNLTWLTLHRTRVSDAGLIHLKPLTNLSHLELAETRVSDAGLEHLAGLSHLRQLNLTGTQVTAAGVAALQKALPKCQIVWAGNAKK
jgi:serine/threonine protein kinase